MQNSIMFMKCRVGRIEVNGADAVHVDGVDGSFESTGFTLKGLLHEVDCLKSLAAKRDATIAELKTLNYDKDHADRVQDLVRQYGELSTYAYKLYYEQLALTKQVELLKADVFRLSDGKEEGSPRPPDPAYKFLSHDPCPGLTDDPSIKAD